MLETAIEREVDMEAQFQIGTDSDHGQLLSDTIHLLQVQSESIKTSIRYGLAIQNAILPKASQLEQHFESFVVYKPKDIVSGDFFWFTDQLPDTRLVFSVIDCTGHGVPGAFMTLIANMLLNRIVNELKMYKPAKILEFVDSHLKSTLNQELRNNHDGMDMGVFMLEKGFPSGYKLLFSGAKNSMYIYREKLKTLTRLKGERRSIGGDYYVKSKDNPFRNHEIHVHPGDVIYMFTDGFIDQNGPDRSRFGTGRLEHMLEKIAPFPMAKQHEMVLAKMDAFRSGEELRDDLTFVALKIV